MPDLRSRPVGAVLAGGRGRRIGGAKAITPLAGRPLIAHALAVMAAVLEDVVVVAKSDSELPELPGIEVWIEPDAPAHPLVGICHALRRAAGRPVLICAADLPFVTTAVVARLAEAEPGDAAAVVVASGGALQPLLACYQPRASGPLEEAAKGGRAPLRQVVAAMGPVRLDLDDPRVLFNVNSAEDLAEAEGLMGR